MNGELTKECFTCAKVGLCAQTGVRQILSGFLCPLFTQVAEPIVLARSQMVQLYGLVPAARALLREAPDTNQEEFTSMSLEAPPQGTTYSERKKQLEIMSFMDVRILGAKTYKYKDGNDLIPVLDWDTTLQVDRKTESIEKVLQFELANNMIVPDAAAPQSNQQPQTQGVPQMSQPPFPPNGAPPMPAAFQPQGVPMQQPMPPAPPPGFPQPQQQAFQPQGAPQQTFQPPPAPFGMPPAPQMPQGMPQPSQMPQMPPQAPPQQQAPQQEAAPATTGKKKKSGAAVAPPPGAVPQQMPPQGMPQQAAPPQFQAPPAPQGFPQAPPQFQQPQGFPQGGPPPMMNPQPQVPQQAPQTAPAQVDLSPVLGLVDSVGKAVNNLGAAEADASKQLLTAVGELRQLMLAQLVALHHLYITDQRMATSIQGKNVNDVQSWMTYLSTYFPK